MLPKLNQPGKFYGTAKTNKFNTVNEITISNLKFRPLIAQTGTYMYNAVQTYMYNAVQVVAQYLKLSCSDNIYIIRST